MITDHPQIVKLRVDPKDVETTGKHVKQYTSLVVKSELSLQQTRKEILLSYKSGYVFIQTDKPIYTPDHNGKFNIIIDVVCVCVFFFFSSRILPPKTSNSFVSLSP